MISQLRHVMDPDLGSDIVTLGFIKNLTIEADAKVNFVLELTTPACPVKEDLKAQCVREVEMLPWVKSASVILSSRPITGQGPAAATEVRRMLMSCFHYPCHHHHHIGFPPLLIRCVQQDCPW